jgi:tyrosine-protein kinase Etk/Wzc
MPLPGEKPQLNVAAQPPQPPPPAPGNRGPPGQEHAGASLAFYLEAISQGRWLVVGALAVAGLGLAWVLATQTPLYEADILLQVDPQPQNNSLMMGANIEGALSGPQSRVPTEIEVMQSRRLLGVVVDNLHLDVSASPLFFPKIGGAIAVRRGREGLASPVLGLKRYAWGGERIVVTRFDVPASLEDTTIAFTLLARDGGTFDLVNSAGRTVATGEVGKPLTWNMATPSGEAPATVFIQELRARPGTEFRLRKDSRAEAAKGLASSLKFAEKGKYTGLIRVSMTSGSPQYAVAVLNSFAQAYLRHNVEKRSDEAEKTLKFLDAQIPVLRENLEVAEKALERYKVEEGTAGVDLTLATTSTLEKSADLEKRLSEMELQRKELLFRFTGTHPVLQALNEKVAFLRAERDAINEQIAQLPEAESTSLRLRRDVTVATGLYLALLNRSQELKITKSGLTGNVRVLDFAVTPETPINPKTGQKVAFALAAGLLGGILLAIARKSLHQGLIDPSEVERASGLIVRASIPHSDRQVALEKERRTRKGARLPVLAETDPTDMAAESVRSLRTSLQFALMDAPNRVIAIGGPRPGVGKSFVTANLARVFADAGKRVLLLDADLRKGSLHGYLGIHRTPGLAEAISGEVSIADVLHKTELAGIDFIPRGSSPTNPSELLGSERFRHMVEDLAGRYDLVLIDLPPVLAVTDAALVGRVAGVNLLVLRAGWHPVRELQQAVKAYAENGVRLSGIVFNDVPPRKGGVGNYAYAYQYHYQYAYKPRTDERDEK